jgi:SAM-dependent methyltransferase
MHFGAFKERFCWVSSYDVPEDPRLINLDRAMKVFYQKDAGAQGYFEQAEAGNANWLSGDYPFQEAVLKKVEPDQLVVEFSCGNGYPARAFATLGARYVGFDLSLSSSGKNTAAPAKTLLVAGSGYQAPIRSNMADWVVSFFVIEHIVWPMRFLDEMMRACAPRGRVALAFPDYLADQRKSINSIRLGRSPGRIHDKFKNLRWLDTLQSTVELKVLYPTLISRWRSEVYNQRRCRFLINTAPECLVGPYRSDNDAVYFASEEEICMYFQKKGFEVVMRSRDVVDRQGRNQAAELVGNGFVIARKPG